jgi:hypothetical protein
MHMRALLQFGASRRGRRTIFLPQPLKAGCAHPICRISPAHLSMRGFIVAAALALTMDEC